MLETLHEKVISWTWRIFISILIDLLNTYGACLPQLWHRPYNLTINFDSWRNVNGIIICRVQQSLLISIRKASSSRGGTSAMPFSSCCIYISIHYFLCPSPLYLVNIKLPITSSRDNSPRKIEVLP